MDNSPYWLGYSAESWGKSWGFGIEVDEPITGGRRRPRVTLAIGVHAPTPKRYAQDEEEALLLCAAL